MSDTDNPTGFPPPHPIPLSDGSFVRITDKRPLGEGWTAVVYPGEYESHADPGKIIAVAVKMMKAHAGSIFEEETQTLALLKQYEEEANRQYETEGLKVAPRYYGMGKLDETPFLVMERIQGKEIHDELEEKGHPFEEPVGLKLGWQFFRTLEIIHTRFNCTYVDLKFEDLWLSESRDDPRLRMIDFGNFEKIDADHPENKGVRRDLLRAGVYLCAILTGVKLNFSGSELQESAAKVIEKADLSSGTRQLLRELLHPNPLRRLASAGEVVDRIGKLKDYWEQDLDLVYDLAAGNIEDAEKPETGDKENIYKSISYARSALEIACIRFPEAQDKIDALLRRAEKVAPSDFLQRGIQLYQGRSYAAAQKVFEEARYWAENPATPRRWSYVARLGADVSSDVFDKMRNEVSEIVLLMEDSASWDMVAGRLEQLEKRFPKKTLKILKAECELNRSLQKARDAQNQNRFKAAADYYEKAQEALEGLPDAAFVSRYETGDLKSKAEQTRQEDSSRGQAYREIEEAHSSLDQGEWEQAVYLARAALSRNRDDEAFSAKYIGLAGRALELGSFRTALTLAETGLNAVHADVKLLKYARLARNLLEMEIAWNEGRIGGYTEKARYVISSFRDLPLMEAVLKQQLQKAADQILQGEDLEALQDIEKTLALMNTQDSEWMSLMDEVRGRLRALKSQRDESARERSARLYNDALEIYEWNRRAPANLENFLRGGSLLEMLQWMKNRKIRLQEAIIRLREAGQSAQFVQSTETLNQIDDLQSKINKELERLDRQLENTDGLMQQEEGVLNSLKERWEALQAQQKWLQTQETLLRMTSSSRDVETGKWNDDVQQLLREVMAYRVQTGEKEHAPTQEMLEEILQALEYQEGRGWLRFAQAATDEEQAMLGQIKQARIAFESGRAEDTQAVLLQLANKMGGKAEWVDLKIKVMALRAFQSFYSQHSNTLNQGLPHLRIFESIRAYARLPIPPTYWQISPLSCYLEAAVSKAGEKVVTGAKLGAARYKEIIREHLTAIALKQSLPGSYPSPRGKPWNMQDYLQAVFHAAYISENPDKGQAVLDDFVERRRLSLDELDASLEQLENISIQIIFVQKQQKREKILQWRRNLLRFGIPAVGLLALGFLGWLLYQNREPIAQALGWVTETPPPASSPVSSTATISPTPTWTAIPSATLLPTFTPTPVLTNSSYLLDAGALGEIYPALPAIEAEQAWLFPVDVIEREDVGTVWSTDTFNFDSHAQQVSSPGEYTANGNSKITWQWDQPFYEGLYYLYTLDSATHSGNTGVIPFTVTTGKNSEELKPLLGNGSVDYLGTAYSTEDFWSFVGAYRIPTGGALRVQADVPAFEGGNSQFPLTPLLALKLDEKHAEPAELELPQGSLPFALLDDTASDWYAAAQESDWIKTDATAWKGSFLSQEHKQLTDPLGTAWQIPGSLPPGTYQLAVWVPELHATAAVHYVLADASGAPLGEAAGLVQVNYTNEWVVLDSLYTVTQDTPDAGVIMTVDDPAGQGAFEVAVDVVALLWVVP